MKVIKIKAINGLHARPLSEFVKKASMCEGEVLIRKDGNEANGKSMMKLMTLGVKKGDCIELEVKGNDAECQEIELATFLESME